MEKSLQFSVLITLVAIHSVLGVSSILFIILYAFERDVPFITYMAIAIAVSFIIFRRCILIDIYEFFRDGAIDLPGYAKDNYIREKFQKLFRIKDCRDLTEYRLDILSNTSPMIGCKDSKDIQELHNYKIHYIVINIIIVVILLIKYNLKSLLPLLLIWFFSVFKL